MCDSVEKGGEREGDRKTVMARGAMPAGYGWTRTSNTCRPSQRGHLDTAFTPSPSRNPHPPLSVFDWQAQPSTRHHRRMLSPLSAANSPSLFTPHLSSIFTLSPLHTHAAIPNYIIILPHPIWLHDVDALVSRTTPYQLSRCRYDASYTGFD
ncbi:hypothetical protein FNV43_RR19187 [Rhamnella rubrinervis]|uniref:Uncharacterized protein n=1 Tax=Rhamnella rubrinervis TaxID=2594499 RepID=A0A8K0E255_9ROSA|nr:hypothetical protein FNV43_RR19187 [Rhamnella rubrinervis]